MNSNIIPSTKNNNQQITNNVNSLNKLWCHVCQRQFRSTSALYQHGKRLSHLKRAMKISSSRCTTITNGKITSSIQRTKSLNTSISIVRLPSQTLSHETQISPTSTIKNKMIVRKTHHENNSISYTCDLCGCQCWSIRNIHRHIRLHADVRPYTCNMCQWKFKSHSNLMKHLKTSRHQQKNETNQNVWTIDSQAIEQQNKLINQILIIEENVPPIEQKNEIQNKSIPTVDESNNLLEDLHIPDSRLIDGDAAELALIDPNRFEELHKAAECLLNLQGVFYFGEDENGNERANSLLSN